MKVELKGDYKGWEVSYWDFDKRFIAKKDGIELIHSNLKYLTTRIDSFGNIQKKVLVYGYKEIKKGLAKTTEDEYGQAYSWVTYDDGEKSKEPYGHLFEDSKHNDKILEDIKKINEKIKEFEDKEKELRQKIQNKEKELLPVNWEKKTINKI